MEAMQQRDLESALNVEKHTERHPMSLIKIGMSVLKVRKVFSGKEHLGFHKKRNLSEG
jgi:hypothetical protein